MKFKRTYKIPPCSYYDIAGVESWLEDMAKQGLILSKDGFSFGFAALEKARPKKMHYRLVPIDKKDRENASSGPNLEMQEIYENSGWTYVTNRNNDFYIFASEDENAPEPDTYPYIQAIAINNVKKESILI